MSPYIHIYRDESRILYSKHKKKIVRLLLNYVDHPYVYHMEDPKFCYNLPKTTGNNK